MVNSQFCYENCETRPSYSRFWNCLYTRSGNRVTQVPLRPLSVQLIINSTIKQPAEAFAAFRYKVFAPAPGKKDAKPNNFLKLNDPGLADRKALIFSYDL